MSLNGIKPDATPWKNGYYFSNLFKNPVYIKGEHGTLESLSGNPTKVNAQMNATWKYGDFGETHPDILEKTGKSRYNVEMDMYSGFLKIQAVLSDDGKTLDFHKQMTGVGCYEWKSEEELLAFKNTGDSANEPPSHYKIQPDKKGKFLWISGAPGMGKSTSGHYLSKKAGYVYYEGDLSGSCLNPYLPPDFEEPMDGFFKQNFLKEVSQERIDGLAYAHDDFMALLNGKDYNLEPIKNFYSEMCKDILKERNRLGGDWAVVHAIPKKELRDHCKELLGSDLIFIVLNMSKEDQLERVVKRGGDDLKEMNDTLVRAYKTYEPASEDESNAINIYITKDMTRDDVLQQILQVV